MPIYNVTSTLPDAKYIAALEKWIAKQEQRIASLEQEIRNLRKQS